MSPVTQYAEDVINDRIIAGKYVHLACERHLKDIARQGTSEFPFIFSEDKAKRVLEFFGYLKHVKGPSAGKPIMLADFQAFIIGSIFGWLHKDSGKRRFRKSFVQVARKNGKSLLLSGTGIYMEGFDGEYGAQIYATATKKDQAKIVFDDARAMVKASSDLSKRLKVTRDGIFHDNSNSKFVALSKDTKSLDGFDPQLGILDEYHAHPTSEMYDVLVSGMGQREQPLLFIITTAGFELKNPCYEEYNYCCKILEGVLENEEYFAYIAQIDKDDNPQNPAVWIKANPILTSTPKVIDYLKGELKAALDVPAKMRNFLTKNLNVWVDQRDNGYMPMDKWRECYEPVEEWPELKGVECYLGDDLSAKIDLCSITFEFLYEDVFFVKSHSFIPADTLEQKKKTDKVPYDLWVQQGWITVIPGPVIDDRDIIEYIISEVETNGWILKENCFDPWSARQFSIMFQEAAEERGIMVDSIEVPQVPKHLGEPTKNFRELVYQKRVKHDGNPVLTWAMSNAVTVQDKRENITLDKSKAAHRIDPAAATINAHVRAMLNEDTESVYEKRGMRSLL